MMNYKNILTFFLFLIIIINSNIKAEQSIEDIIDVKSKIDFLNEKRLQTREINEKLEGKLNHFNTELYYQLKLLEEDKNVIQIKIQENQAILKKIENVKRENQELILKISLSNNNKLTDIYGTMNPRKSAKILEKLFQIDKKRALTIIMKINKRNLIKILERMKKENAAQITNEINKVMEIKNEK